MGILNRRKIEVLAPDKRAQRLKELRPAFKVACAESVFKNPKQLRMLMYHELGHCMLDRPHTSKKIGQIMSPSVASAYTEAQWEKLIYSFFRELDK